MRSLRLRLLLMLLAAVLVAVGTVALVARRATEQEFERFVDRERRELRTALGELGEMGAPRIVFLGPEDTVVADSFAWPPEVAAAPMTAGKRVEMKVEKPAEGSALDIFYVRLGPPPGVPLPPGQEVFLAGVNRSLLIAGAAGGAAALLLALFFGRRVVGPIEALTVAARRMERGDLSGRVAVGSSDEVGQLGRAFNAMAESLERTERLRRTMVGDVAHELRTPLSNVRGYLEALRDGVAAPTPEVIDSLHEEALLLTRLVDDLQDLTLAEAGQLALAREPTALAELVAGALAAFEPRAAAAGTRLRSEVDTELPPVDVDPRRVGQVLRNLLANALTHTPPGGEVVVSARPDGERAEVAVRDTGVGIAPEHLPHVFERFYRVDRARARATGGAGLGLAIVRELVQAHGGQVSASSEVGRGTTVSFTLPVATGLGQPVRDLELRHPLEVASAGGD
jgi:signal transduction histidine kinase